MAKKAELLEQAHKLKLGVGSSNTIAEIEAALKAAATTSKVKPIKEATDGTIQKSTDNGDQAQEVKLAKAGKHSQKGVQAAEDKQTKLEHQLNRDEVAAETPETKSKTAAVPMRSRLERRSKGYRQAAEQIEKGKSYGLKEALELAVKTSPVKFDATIELHVNLSVDPRQADQNIRDNLILPSGTGKTLRVAVFTDDNPDNADLSGTESIMAALDKGTIDFDILISTPANMAKLGKFARLLGPRGLMPNPKSGTVTTDIQKAVGEAKAGRVEYRVDSTGIVHLGIGKVSFGADKLLANAEAVFASLRASKPSSVKGNFVGAVHLTSTMGPSITVDTSTIS